MAFEVSPVANFPSSFSVSFSNSRNLSEEKICSKMSLLSFLKLSSEGRRKYGINIKEYFLHFKNILLKNVKFAVRQLPDKAAEHLHGERGGGGEASLRDNEVRNSGFLFAIFSLEELTFCPFSEHVGPSHGYLKPQPVISIQYYSSIRMLKYWIHAGFIHTRVYPIWIWYW